MYVTTIQNIGLILWKKDWSREIASLLHEELGVFVVKDIPPFRILMRPNARKLKPTSLGNHRKEKYINVMTPEGEQPLCRYCLYSIRKRVNGDCIPCKAVIQTDWPKGWRTKLLPKMKEHGFTFQHPITFYHTAFPLSLDIHREKKGSLLVDVRKIPSEWVNESKSQIAFPYWKPSNNPQPITVTGQLQHVHESLPYVRAFSINHCMAHSTNHDRNLTSVAFLHMKCYLRTHAPHLASYDLESDLPVKDVSGFKAMEQQTLFRTIKRAVVNPCFRLDGKIYVLHDQALYTTFEKTCHQKVSFSSGDHQPIKDDDFVFDGSTLYQKVMEKDHMGFTVASGGKLTLSEKGNSLSDVLSAFNEQPFAIHHVQFLDPLLFSDGALTDTLTNGETVWVLFPDETKEALRNQQGRVVNVNDDVVSVGFVNGYFVESFPREQLAKLKVYQ